MTRYTGSRTGEQDAAHTATSIARDAYHQGVTRTGSGTDESTTDVAAAGPERR